MFSSIEWVLDDVLEVEMFGNRSWSHCTNNNGGDGDVNVKGYNYNDGVVDMVVIDSSS